MEYDEPTTDVETAIETEAAETAADVAEVVADVVATEAVGEAVATATEAVVEHVDEALAEIRDVVDDTKEGERWTELQNLMLEQENRILTGVRSILAESSSAAPTLSPEQEATAEALRSADLHEIAGWLEAATETEADVLEFDPSAAVETPADASESQPQSAAARRRVRGLRRRG